MPSDSRAIGELLVRRKVLSRHLLEALLAEAEETGVPFVRLLREQDVVAERDLVAATAERQGFVAWDPSEHPIPPLVRGMLPAAAARDLQAVVIGIEDGNLLVAMADPYDSDAVKEIANQTGWPIRPAVTTPADLARAIEETYDSPRGETPSAPELSRPHINNLLTRMVDLGASDLHLTTERAPSVRIDGDIRPLEDEAPLTGSELRELIYGILTERQRERFEADLELDTSHAVPGVGRFRVNVFVQRDSVGAVLRAIPDQVVPLERLGMPKVLSELTRLPRGLVLVTGPTGSGKSTTLASMIDIINSSRPVHIVTIEDPIEFLHQHKRAVVNQREVGEDTKSFAEALRHVLRQDPDVILIGELRDLETTAAALTAAETGHLVFGTLHTQDAAQSVDRIIDIFPSHQQSQIRVQLAQALQAVITQQLLPRSEGRGRVVAAEVLTATPAVRNLVREGKTHQLYSVMQGGGAHGMQTMDHSLAQLVRSGQITMDLALDRCHSVEDLTRLASAALVGTGR